MPSNPIRCRFAPSPTGYLHVGSAQSALFNWMFARGSGGEFVIRIEDTDAERNRPELSASILDSLEWLGIQWDGEIVHQSERGERHREVCLAAADSGAAYWCDCTREEIDARNRASGRKSGYDGFCRDRGLEPGPGRALRFRVPDEGETSWHDLVRGEITFQNSNIEDFVIARSDGSPLFIVANTVDDADMSITHVIRGEDHVNNTPKYLLLWRGLLDRPVPEFAHLPLLVNERRQKLSKRRDDVSVADYRARGYLGEAMRNYLALLGWAPRDGVEIRPIEELIEQFRLEDVSSSSAFFDVKKLLHINGHYIRELPRERFIALASEFLPAVPELRLALDELATPVQERVHLLSEVPEMLAFMSTSDFALSPEVAASLREELPQAVLRSAAVALANAVWTTDGVEEAVGVVAVETGLVKPDGEPRLSKAQAPLRLALTGNKVGIPLWQAIVSLGREETLSRIQAVIHEAGMPSGL